MRCPRTMLATTTESISSAGAPVSLSLCARVPGAPYDSEGFCQLQSLCRTLGAGGPATHGIALRYS
jgi:hypothetical protein